MAMPHRRRRLQSLTHQPLSRRPDPPQRLCTTSVLSSIGAEFFQPLKALDSAIVAMSSISRSLNESFLLTHQGDHRAIRDTAR